MSTSATAATATVAAWSHITVRSGTANDGSPLGTTPTRATPRSPRFSSQDAINPPTTSTRAPGTLGAIRRSPKTTTSATTPTTAVVVSVSPRLPSHDQSSWSAFVPDTSVPVIFGSSPMTTSIAAPKRNPVTTARDRNWAIQPIFSTARSRNRIPDARVMPATNEATSCSPTRPVASTALAATAASPELGPIDICRLVPNIPYRMAPAAAAYRPFCNGIPAIPA